MNDNSTPSTLSNLRTIESSARTASWGGASPLRLSRAIEGTEALGLSWPSDVTDTINAAAQAIALGRNITRPGREPLTWTDISSPDAVERINHAVMQDNLKTLRTVEALTEVTRAANGQVARVITAAAPGMLTQVAKLAEKHQEDRDLALMAAKLPSNLRAKVSRWENIAITHTELLRIAEPQAFEKLERNSSAFALHTWTTQQWLELHESHDTLSEHKLVDWMPWAIENGVSVAPATSVEELASRTKAANDVAENYNKKHRPKRNW